MIHSQNKSKMTKHVGIYNDKRCVIVLQLPEATNEVHIIDADSLPDIYHQNLMEFIDSPEGQAAQWLGDVLVRKMLHDGTNAMRTFYEKKYVVTVPSELVTLTPTPSMHVPFTQIYPIHVDPLAAEYANLAAQEQAKIDAEEVVDDTFNHHATNLASDVTVEKQQIASNLIVEAEMLEGEAKAKRAKAAQMTTTLQGGTGPFKDPVTGKLYKSAGALKGAITKRERNAAN